MKKNDPFSGREARKYENPIVSREYILEFMAELGEPVSFKRLAGSIGYENATDKDALRSRLGAMVRDGQIIADRRNVYAIAAKMELVTGRISAHPDGFGFLVTPGDDEDVFLTERQMRLVFHGDVAQVRIRSRDKRGRNHGEIIDVLERNTDRLVGKVCFDGVLYFLEPANNRIIHEIYLQLEPGEALIEGQIVVATILRQPGEKSHVLAKVVEVLGDHLTPDIEVEIALRNNEIPSTWTDEVMAEVNELPDQVAGPDKNRRKDLRDLDFVTIDGSDARDFDDAVYCEARPRGGWRLFVAIADVANYVRVGSALDTAAYERSTSVYFPQFVVPMLPEKLSNGLCSLNPRVDRLVMVCEMTLSARGNVSSYVFYEGVIHSSARLTYAQVAELLEGDQEEFLYPELKDPLLRLFDLYKVLANARAERSALEFESTELGFAFNDVGDVENIFPTDRNVAHKVIEECMLCANVSAARFISRHEAPGLFRVHEPPDVARLEKLSQFLGKFGIKVATDVEPQTIDYQRILAQLKSKPNSRILQMSVLRSLNQAVYQPENKGHFGLGYKEYTHFTSPIRRYPDLLTHRYIKQIIHSGQETKLVERFGRARKKANYYPYDQAEVIAMGEHTSFAERRADSAVYEVLEWIKCNYINQRLGETLDGVITGVTKFGFFVELTDIYVEGLVHVSTLSGDYYQFDPGSQMLTGERTGVHYSMGDVVRVQVVRVNLEERKIDFEMVSHSPLSSRRKSAVARRSAGKKKGDNPKKANSGRRKKRG